jgi:hypothetical protein
VLAAIHGRTGRAREDTAARHFDRTVLELRRSGEAMTDCNCGSLAPLRARGRAGKQNEENKCHCRLLRTDCATRILRIGICWSERKRGSAGNTAVGSKDRKEGMLRCEGNLRYPAALRSARRDSDYR